MKMGKIEAVVAGMVGLMVLIGLNMTITKTLIDQAVDEYAQSIPAQPKPIVVDMDTIVKDLTEQGEQPIDVVVYTQTLNALLVKEGYLVLDKRSVLSYHPRYAYQPIPKDVLLAAAKKAGIDFEGPARVKMEEALTKGRALVDEMLTPQ